jgi:hypothetical protein
MKNYDTIIYVQFLNTVSRPYSTLKSLAVPVKFNQVDGHINSITVCPAVKHIDEQGKVKGTIPYIRDYNIPVDIWSEEPLLYASEEDREKAIDVIGRALAFTVEKNIYPSNIFADIDQGRGLYISHTGSLYHSWKTANVEKIGKLYQGRVVETDGINIEEYEVDIRVRKNKDILTVLVEFIDGKKRNIEFEDTVTGDEIVLNKVLADIAKHW